MDEEKIAFAKGEKYDSEYDGSLSKPTGKAGKADIALMIFINFLSFVCFAIVLPSLSPFIKKDLKYSKDYWLGLAVGLNSFGTFVGSPVFGKWADKRGVKEVILVSLVIMVAGNIAYSMSLNIYMLIIARFFVGLSAANYAPASAYLAYATTVEQRTLVMTLNSAASILGFAVGPSMATPFAGSAFKHDVWKFSFNEYTWPGYISAFLAAIGFVLTLLLFRDVEKPSADSLAAVAQTKTETVTINSESDQSEEDLGADGDFSAQSTLQGSVKQVSVHAAQQSQASMSSISSMKKVATGEAKITYVHILLLVLQFGFYCAFTVFETIGTLYVQNGYDWSTTLAGYLFTGIGVDCVIALVVLQIFVSVLKIPELYTLLIAQALMILGFICLISYPFDEYVSLWRFLVGVFAASGAFSAACALLISVFSKVSEGLEQGLLMGLLSSAGSIARMIGPVAATLLMGSLGPGVLFTVVVEILLLTFAANVAVIVIKHVEDKRAENKKPSTLRKREAIEKTRRPTKGRPARRNKSGLSTGNKVHPSLDPARLQAQSGNPEEQEYP